MLNFHEHPPVLNPGVASLQQLAGQWWVGHTKSRCEKAFARDLCAKNIGYFLPMVEKTTYSGGRKRRNLAILFPSYVFICGSTRDRLRAVVSDRLCRILEIPDQERFREELFAIERVLNIVTELEHYPFGRRGKNCRVIAGPLQGMRGVMLEGDECTRLLLEVSALGQGVALEIDSGLLETIP